MHTRGGDAATTRSGVTPRVCIIFLLIQRPVWVRDKTQEQINHLKKRTKQNEVKGRHLLLGLVFCHGAHTREEQEHADEDILQNNSL